MKRFLIAVASLLLICSVQASAQGFGVTAGMNFNSAKIEDVRTDARAGWNIGVTYGLDLPLGFSVQPSLVFIQKAADYSPVDAVTALQKVSSINIPVSVQWGPDLIVARPFIDVTPYLGYSMSNKFKGNLADIVKLAGIVKVETSLANAFEYGVGLGAGLNVWKLQAIVRYNWNFGTLGKLSDFKDLQIGDFKTENETFGGISVSVAFFF